MLDVARGNVNASLAERYDRPENGTAGLHADYLEAVADRG